MAILKTIKPQHVIYEHVELNILVAISTEDTQKIKSFWKKHKGKSEFPAEIVSGHRFIQDEEQGSLKINFEETEQFEIKHLQKYS